MRAIYTDKNIPKALIVKALKPLWPGVVFSSLSPSKFDNLPEPALPGPRWIRVKNIQCGVCASDVSIFFIEAHPSIAQVALPGYKRIFLGHEVVGYVAEAGKDVTKVKAGDRVIMDTRFQGANCFSQEIKHPCRSCIEGNAPLCENASLNLGPKGIGGGWGDGFTAHETEVYKVPESLSDDEAMMVEPISTGLRAVFRKIPEPGAHALIIGSGIVGLNTLQCLRAESPKCRISIMARYPHQSALAKKFGADEVIEREDGYEATARITGAKLYKGVLNNKMILGGFNVIYDCVGSERTIEDSLRWAKGRGTVVLVGIDLKPLKLDLNPVWYQEVDLVGLFAHGMEKSKEGKAVKTYDIVIDLMLKKKIRIEGLITHRFPLERWKEAMSVAMDKKSGSIKVVLECGK